MEMDKNKSKIILKGIFVVVLLLFMVASIGVIKEGQRNWSNKGNTRYKLETTYQSDSIDVFTAIYVGELGALESIDFTNDPSFSTPIKTLYAVNKPEYSCGADLYGRRECVLESDTIIIWKQRKEPCHWYSMVCEGYYVQFERLEGG